MMEQFTVEEINLICFFDTSNRNTVIQDLVLAIEDFEDAELIEIAKNTLKKIEKTSDEAFSSLVLCPIYDDDEMEVYE